MDHTRTLLDVLSAHATAEPKKTAFTFHENAPCTFGELWTNINRFAGFLIKKGLKPKDRVVIVLPNSSFFFTAFYGVLRAGGIAVPIYPHLTKLFTISFNGIEDQGKRHRCFCLFCRDKQMLR